MKTEQNKTEQEANFNYWFRMEFFLSWLTIFISFFIVYIYLSGTSFNPSEISFFGYFFILFLIILMILPALLHALITTRLYIMKSKSFSFNQNIIKSISVVAIYIIIGYFFLTRKAHRLDNEPDILGRTFDYNSFYHDGKDFFHTIVVGSLIYLILSSIQLYRMNRKTKT